MPPGIATGGPAHLPPEGHAMSTSRSAWSVQFGAHLRLLGMDVMLLEAIKIGATLYEHAGHLNPDDAAALYAADRQPGHAGEE